MKSRTRWWIALAALALVVSIGLLPLVPVSQNLTLPIVRAHTYMCTGCQIEMSYSIHGATSIFHILLGIGPRPFANPYEFVANNSYYAVAFEGAARTPDVVGYGLFPFPSSPFSFSSIVLRANAAPFNGSSLVFTVKNVGNESAQGLIYVGNGWGAPIPLVSPGETYSGNSTGWLQGPPSLGTMFTLVVTGLVKGQHEVSISVIDTTLTA